MGVGLDSGTMGTQVEKTHSLHLELDHLVTALDT